MSVNNSAIAAAPPPPGLLPGQGPRVGQLARLAVDLRPQGRTRIGRAMSASVIVHLGLVLLVLAAMTVAPAELLRQEPPLEYKVVFKQDPGPGGGGGGSPAPAPAKKSGIPKHKAPEDGAGTGSPSRSNLRRFRPLQRAD